MSRGALYLTCILALAPIGCDGDDPTQLPADAGVPDQAVVDFHVYPDSVFADGGTLPARRPDPYAMAVELSTPAYTGRKSGTPGGTKAAKYIAARFAECGVEPFGDSAASYLHAFKITPIVHTGKMAMTLQPKAGAAASFPYRKTWRPGRTSPGGDVTGKLVFIGYGIDDKKHDDYKGLDVTGAVVVAFRGCPPGVGDEQTCNDVAKVHTAKKYKAKGFILLAEDDWSVNIWGGSQGHELLPMLTAVMKQTPAEAFLPAGKTLKGLRDDLNKKGPQSLDTGHKLRLLLSRKAIKDAIAYNVLGVVRPVGTTVKQYVVAGAHYDHLGFDMPPFIYFPGALDNASGTAVIVDAACRLAAEKKLSIKRNLVFGLWGAEEDGLIGSREWLDAKKLKASEIDYSVNLDMVGGAGDGDASVDISPADSAALKPTLEKVTKALKLKSMFGTINSGRSDHANFMARGIKSVYMYGPHPQGMQYHTAADTPIQLSSDKLVQQAKVLAAWMKALANK